MSDQKDKKNIYVTQPSLAPLEQFLPYLNTIWENKILTNGGPYHQQLEQKLCDYLGVKYISLFTNATIALVTALQTLKITGEVITTPFSFVATSHSILWNGLKPVFVDIDPISLNIDPQKIEQAITPQTSAIMAVHVYGRPCDHKAIQKIADKYNLKVIYDAAHAFAVKDSSGSILNYGDLAIVSFHATKVFNTFEGGAIVCKDLKTKQHIDHLKNFGFVDEITVVEAGINGKMSEINAAFGLLQLEYVDEYIRQRSHIAQLYREKISLIPGLTCLCDLDLKQDNYAYFPIRIGPTYPLTRDQLYHKLKDQNIFSRRYFYPLISDFPMYKDLPSSSKSNLQVADLVASEVLCLPIYPALKVSEIEKIVSLLNG